MFSWFGIIEHTVFDLFKTSDRNRTSNAAKQRSVLRRDGKRGKLHCDWMNTAASRWKQLRILLRAYPDSVKIFPGFKKLPTANYGSRLHDVCQNFSRLRNLKYVSFSGCSHPAPPSKNSTGIPTVMFKLFVCVFWLRFRIVWFEANKYDWKKKHFLHAS